MNNEKSSYEKINYSLRPAKSIERKMICEVMNRLSLIRNINEYRYIGFGSTYFTDFSLIHKSLGIKDLISIERDIQNKDRFAFNKPFSCIDLKFGVANEILPSIKWNKPTIIWLDYDYKLNRTMFSDIETFFFSAKPGSLFIITIDVKPDLPKSEIENESLPKEINIEGLKKFRIEKLSERVGATKIPLKYREVNLNIHYNPLAVYEIINDQILETVSKRNGGLNKKNQIIYKQLFNFIYDDGTLMLTIGGLIHNEEQTKAVEKMQFNDLEFIKEGGDPFKINVPKLTFMEIRSLDSLLPDKINVKTGKLIGAKKNNLKNPVPPLDDIVDYTKIYRYFPTFAEANL